MSTRNRAWRRAQRARMIQHALRSERIRWWYYPTDDNSPKSKEYQDHLREMAARQCDRLAACSCYMCGNQRHNDWQSNWDMLTLQERRAYNAFLDGLKEAEDLLDK